MSLKRRNNMKFTFLPFSFPKMYIVQSFLDFAEAKSYFDSLPNKNECTELFLNITSRVDESTRQSVDLRVIEYLRIFEYFPNVQYLIIKNSSFITEKSFVPFSEKVIRIHLDDMPNLKLSHPSIEIVKDGLNEQGENVYERIIQNLPEDQRSSYRPCYKYYNRDGYDQEGYDRDGYDQEGYDRLGFSKNGYDRDGYDRLGFNKYDFNKYGFDRRGYNIRGYDKYGYDREGYDKNKFDRRGYNRAGYNAQGYDRNGVYGGKFDEYGYNSKGYNIRGYNYEGYDRNGYDEYGYDIDGCDFRGDTLSDKRYY